MGSSLKKVSLTLICLCCIHLPSYAETNNEEARFERIKQIRAGDQLCKKVNASYRVCDGSFGCWNRETDGVLAGVVDRKYENGFLSLRVLGLANMPEMERQAYEMFGGGAFTAGNLRFSPGDFVRIDPLEFVTCSIN